MYVKGKAFILSTIWNIFKQIFLQKCFHGWVQYWMSFEKNLVNFFTTFLVTLLSGSLEAWLILINWESIVSDGCNQTKVLDVFCEHYKYIKVSNNILLTTSHFLKIFRSLGKILRLQNLQLQRQRCSRLERFFKGEKNIFVSKTHLAY
jgi:hypothetical protein